MSKINLKNYTKKSKSGFTLIEVLVVIGISALILSATITTFSSMGDMQSLDKDIEVAESYLIKAKNQTVNARSGIQYGVHFASSTITLFNGTVYSAGSSTNSVYSLSNKAEISSIGLSGQTRVYFERVTGEPSATGTITFRLKSRPTITKSLIIHATGLVEVSN
jgi:prepilin-type N-terminal cleavage/methylation domain-containing protein